MFVRQSVRRLKTFANKVMRHTIPQPGHIFVRLEVNVEAGGPVGLCGNVVFVRGPRDEEHSKGKDKTGFYFGNWKAMFLCKELWVTGSCGFRRPEDLRKTTKGSLQEEEKMERKSRNKGRRRRRRKRSRRRRRRRGEGG